MRGSTHERINIIKEISGSPSLSKMREADEVGKDRVVLESFRGMTKYLNMVGQFLQFINFVKFEIVMYYG